MNEGDLIAGKHHSFVQYVFKVYGMSYDDILAFTVTTLVLTIHLLVGENRFLSTATVIDLAYP